MSFSLEYSLYVKVANKYEVVTDPIHTAILSKIRAADPSPMVAATTSEAVDRHVNSVAWPLPIEGHLIDLGSFIESLWVADIKDWVDWSGGASNIYKVYPAGSTANDAILFLQAAVSAGQRTDNSTSAGA